jgi:hypothetical protein
MPSLVSIVEGDGEEQAVPILLRRLLQEAECWDLQVARPKKANGVGNLLRPGGIERFIQLAALEPDCAAILVLLDAEKQCPVDLARSLAVRVRAQGSRYPVGIVVAKCEYEAWLLASAETLTRSPRLRFPAALAAPEDPEAVTGAKGWLSRQLPKDQAYSETRDQPALTSLMDLDLARRRSRSFRRFCSAIEQVMAALRDGRVDITPA